MKKSIIFSLIGMLLGAGIAASTAFALSVFLPFQGGTGTSTIPTFGKILMGNNIGTYDVVSTSSLGLTGFVPYVGATRNVDLGLFGIKSQNSTTTNILSLGTEGNTGYIIAPNATSADTIGTNITVNLGNGTLTQAGGVFTVNGGTGGLTGGGGQIDLIGGNSGATSGSGGNIMLVGGQGISGGFNGGNVLLQPGLGTTGATNGMVMIYDPSSTHYAILNTASISGTDKTYTFPNKSGIFAMTSDLTSLTGSGTNGFVTRWASSTGLTTGKFLDDGIVTGVNATSSLYTFNVQANSATNPFNVASSSGVTMFNIDTFGSTTISNFGSGLVGSLVGKLYNYLTTGSGSAVLATAPTMTNPIVGTQTAGDNSTKAASTAYVDSAIAAATSTGITGSGSKGLVTVWSGTSALTTGILQDNGTVAGVNATTSGITFNIKGNANSTILSIASSTGASLITVNQKGQFLQGDGLQGSPSYAFTNFPSSGMWVDGNGVYMSYASGKILTVAATGVTINGSSTVTNLNVANAPVYSLSTGALYNNSTTGTGATVQQTSPTLTGTAVINNASTTNESISGNFYVTGTSALASTTMSGTLGIATTTPNVQLSVAAGSIAVKEANLSTSTTMVINWASATSSNQVTIKLGTGATSISMSNVAAGQKLVAVACNPANASAGALTWTGIYWSGGTAPTQTTGANRCDIWSFLGTMATGTTPIVFGAANTNF